jgi:predicted ATPase/transcriptional regulator with XRE-family HTH domain
MKGTYQPIFFGEWLKIRRKALDLTQAELAHSAGCSVHALRKIESGERRPSKQLASLLANSLEIASADRATFVKVSRGELNLDRLPSQYFVPQAAPISGPKLSVELVNLPATPTPLIGRQQELSTLRQLLEDPQCRMVTLVGPGGIGKTRLAIEMAYEQKTSYPDGVYFVSLASFNSPTFLIPAIAGELGVILQGQIEPRFQLINYLKAKNILLLLDNFEHLLAGIDLLAEILERSPGVKLLVTSRERLNLHGEWIFEISGLPVPATNTYQNAAEYSSIQLFLQSAGRNMANFELHEDGLQSVVRICQVVEGMPLGIELAAAWVSVLSCREIAQEIESNLDFLTTTMRDVPERQRSLRAAFNHSWNLLSEQERRILQQMSVFQGCFSRKAAQEVAEANLLSLLSLVSKSLVRRTENGCYDLHEVVRLYAHDHLDQDPNKELIYTRHSNYYLAFLKDQEQELQSHAQYKALQELSDEIDNLHAAWSWAVNHDRFELIGDALRSFGALCEIRGWLNEGLKYLDLVIQRLRANPDFKHQPRLLGQALAQQGLLYFRQGSFEHAQAVLEESISILSPIGDLKTLTIPLVISGVILFLNGEIENSEARLDEGLEHARAAGDEIFEAYAVYNKGYIESLLGHYNDAYEQMLTGLAMWRDLGDPHSIALGLNYISPTAIKLGLHDQAHAYLEESLLLCQQVGDRWGLGTAYRHLGLLALAQANPSEAKSNLQKSIAIFAEFITGWDIARSMIYLGETAIAAGELLEAERIFVETLPITMDAKAWPLVMDILVGLAELYSQTGKVEQAGKLSSYALQHYASIAETKNRAVRVAQASEDRSPDGQFKKISEWAKGQSLESIVSEILGEEFLSPKI